MIKPKPSQSKRNSFLLLLFYPLLTLLIRVCLGVMLFPQSYQYPNLSEGADRVGGQLRGDKECPFNGVTKSGRVWRKVLESDAQSVIRGLTVRWRTRFLKKRGGDISSGWSSSRGFNVQGNYLVSSTRSSEGNSSKSDARHGYHRCKWTMHGWKLLYTGIL